MNTKHTMALAVALMLAWPTLSGAAEAEEEGKLELTDQQIQAAGIQLAPAQSRQISTMLSLPGEVRFDEDRTSHIVPRAAGVVESVKVNLGQSVKKGELLAVIASQQISDQRSELAASQRRVELARTTFQRERQLWQDKISADQHGAAAQGIHLLPGIVQGDFGLLQCLARQQVILFGGDLVLP